MLLLLLDGIARDLHFCFASACNRIQMVEREERMSKRQNGGYTERSKRMKRPRGMGWLLYTAHGLV
jgi:hypothetical protein